ncbi:hypothetical protein KFL_016890010, partial [Klebsormidium nitens]
MRCLHSAVKTAWGFRESFKHGIPGFEEPLAEVDVTMFHPWLGRGGAGVAEAQEEVGAVEAEAVAAGAAKVHEEVEAIEAKEEVEAVEAKEEVEVVEGEEVGKDAAEEATPGGWGLSNNGGRLESKCRPSGMLQTKDGGKKRRKKRKSAGNAWETPRSTS